MNPIGSVTAAAIACFESNRARRERNNRAASLDAYTLDWLHLHRLNQGEAITTLGRRWLTRVIWHQEERVETSLRSKL